MRNPRIFVTLDPELATSIRVIAKHSGKSASAVISEFVTPRRAHLIQMADALERLSRLPQPLSTTLQARLDDLVEYAEQLEVEASTALDQLTLELASEDADNHWADARADGQRKRSRSVRASAEKPPAFNKGVTNPGSES